MDSKVIALLTKEIFLELDIKGQIEYLNKELKEGKTVTEIRKEIGIGEKKLLKIIRENGYKYNQKTRKYESSSVVIREKDKTETTKNKEVDNVVLLKLINEINEMKKINTKVVEMYEWYELQKNTIEPTRLTIEPRDNSEVTVKSYKVYSTTENNFQKFCKKNKHLKVQDLISKALDEFIERYN